MLYILVVGLLIVVCLPFSKSKKVPPPTVNKNPYNIEINNSDLKKEGINKNPRNRKQVIK